MSQISGNSCSIITLLPLGVDCESINASSPIASNGLISIFITGGTPPYITTWSNGSQGSYIFNLLPGSYTATTTDYYGDFTATTVCTVGSDSFYLEKFQSCSNSSNFIYYLANTPSNFLTDKVYKLSGQDGCWTNKGLVLWSGQTYLNLSAATFAGPYNQCKGCVTVDPVIPPKPNQLCLQIKQGIRNPLITNNQFYSASTINGKESWTSSTSPYIVYFNSGTTKWQLSGWTGPGTVEQTPSTNSPLGTWTVYGTDYLEVFIYSGSCVVKPTIKLTINKATCEEAEDGSVSINASNGTAPYTYSLNGVTYGASNMFIGLTSGSYTAYVKDATNQVTTQNFTVGVSSTQTQYVINLVEQPVSTPIINNIGKYTEITNNVIVSVSPPLILGKSIELDLVHSVSMKRQTGVYSNTQVSPTLTYSFTTGVTTGAIVTGYTTPSITSTSSQVLTCPTATQFNTAYTETFKLVLSGGTFTGQIVKRITTPDASVLGCQTYGEINDSFTVINAKLTNQNSCETINKQITPLVLNLKRTGGFVNVD